METPNAERGPAFMEGWHAFHQGRSETANPYEPTEDDCLDWNDGFSAAADEEA